ncbi:MAG TPA: cytochrome P450 [Dongiaceae bacterium]|nr:cytochrome P450 [Dongiaceae bacterium]
MADSAGELARRSRAAAYSLPIEAINPADPELFRSDTLWPYFERLRREDPVHHARDARYGPYWSVTRYDDIVAVDTDHQTFSAQPSILIGDPDATFTLQMFVAMDPPRHDVQRRIVSPAFAPQNLTSLEPTIRRRASEILDGIAIGDELDWVDKVSIELTTMTLAVLLDFPWEDRRKLTRWSDVTTATFDSGVVESPMQRREELLECLDYFQRLRDERAVRPGNDLISLLAHGDSTRNMDRMEFLGNLMLLIVGGNDTTRNAISGSVVALNENPEQYAKLRADPGLIPSMVSETIRWQTPIAYVRRTATRDTALHGKAISKGDKVVMWYVSGNRDETAIPDPDRYDIERPQVRRHLSFGSGIHRCLGSRLAELQLRIIWEEILKRFSNIELTGEPQRVLSSFIRGYEFVPVRIG